MSEKRKLTDNLAADLVKYYIHGEAALRVILDPFIKLQAAPNDIRRAKEKIKEVVMRLNIVAIRWARSAIIESYRSKRDEVGAKAKNLPILAIPKVEHSTLTVPRLVEQTQKTLLAANATIERTTYNFIAAWEKAVAGVESAEQRTPMQFMSATMSADLEWEVESYIAKGWSASKVSAKIKRYLQNLVEGADFVEVNGKFYGMRAYTEMVARSEMHKAQVEATIDECDKWGADLVQFSTHDDPCERCAPLEGMVFSISGNAEDFPALDDPVEVEVSVKDSSKTVQVDPKFPHPNCEHNLNPVTHNILAANAA